VTDTDAILGYRRADGSLGVRNVLLVLPAGQCANALALQCAEGVAGAFALLHTQPCAHLGEDNTAAANCLAGLGRNPNAAAVLVLGMGCDVVSAEDLAQRIATTGKPVRCLTVEAVGDWESAVHLGRSWLERQADAASRLRRERATIQDLSLGVKCGGSDATSALAGNPAVGRVVDRLVEMGGTVVFSETTELIGAEHLLLERAPDPRVRGRMLASIRATEERIRATGVDPRGTQPTPGNIAGGLSTLEEKSLGGVLKTGSSSISGVFPWGDAPQGPGLHLMDCPANVPQLLLGWAAAGCQLLVFSVGGGLPARIPSLIGTNVGPLPLLPIIKVLSNPNDKDAACFFDVYAGEILEGGASLPQVSAKLWGSVLEAASGTPTYLESYCFPAVQVWELLLRGPTV